MTNVGVFDSGLGGLTVLNELAKNKPANYFYLGDSKRAPYGIRPADEIISFSDQIVNFLESYDIDQYVIACNTISVLASQYLLEKYHKDFIPITDAGLDSAKEYKGSYLVLGTNATINSHYYKKRLGDFIDDEVYEVAASALAGLIEKGVTSGKEMDNYLNEYLSIANEKKIDNILLACTHYPIIEKPIRETLTYPANLINPALKIAKEIDTIDSPLKVNIFMTDIGLKTKMIIDEIMDVPYNLELKEI